MYDTMLGTHNCPNLHRYLNKEFYDEMAIKIKFIQQFGFEEVNETEDEMEKRYGKKPEMYSISEYLRLLEAMIAEDYH